MGESFGWLLRETGLGWKALLGSTLMHPTGSLLFPVGLPSMGPKLWLPTGPAFMSGWGTQRVWASVASAGNHELPVEAAWSSLRWRGSVYACYGALFFLLELASFKWGGWGCAAVALLVSQGTWIKLLPTLPKFKGMQTTALTASSHPGGFSQILENSLGSSVFSMPSLFLFFVMQKLFNCPSEGIDLNICVHLVYSWEGGWTYVAIGPTSQSILISGNNSL